MKRVLETFVVFLSILASIVSEHGTDNEEAHSFLLAPGYGTIWKISLDDSNYTTEGLQLGEDVGMVADVDFDPLEGKIYWTDYIMGVMRRAYLNGSGRQDITARHRDSTPDGIAIDHIARKLYWTDWRKHHIQVSDLNGNNRKVIMRDETAHPNAIVVDPKSERIYWTGYKKNTSRIESSLLDGTNRSVIINTDVQHAGLALDHERQIIYWASERTNTIEMANVGGSGRRVLISNNISYISGLTILGDYIYWTDAKNRVIERADKITGDKRQVIVDHFNIPWRLKSIILRNITEQTCDSLVNPQHGYIRGLTNNSVNSVATFACHPGYRLVGEENATCLWIDNKLQWSNPTPECVKGEKCKGFSFDSYNFTYDPELEEDFWTEMEHPHGTRATVTCEDGFEIFPLRPVVTNTATTVCVNGQWKPDIVNCTPARCSCTKLPQEMIERKRKLKYCDQFAPSGTYDQMTECEEGYKARGNYRARCCFGVWSIHTPVTQYYRCIRNKSVKDCHLDLKGKDDLTVLHRNHTFEGQEVDFVHRSTIKFSCKSFYSTLEGAKNVTCIDGQWSKEIPTCKRTSGFDFLHSPFLGVYFANFNRINTDDGRVMIPKRNLFRIVCLSPEKRQLTLHERNSAGKQLLKVNFTSEDMFSSVKVINPVGEKMEATVECINSKGISTEFNVIIADTCEVDENELNRRGLQVVPDSRQRIYVEGDRIQVECSSNENRTDQFIIICKSGREWEYANNMDC